MGFPAAEGAVKAVTFPSSGESSACRRPGETVVGRRICKPASDREIRQHHSRGRRIRSGNTRQVARIRRARNPSASLSGTARTVRAERCRPSRSSPDKGTGSTRWTPDRLTTFKADGFHAPSPQIAPPALWRRGCGQINSYFSCPQPRNQNLGFDLHIRAYAQFSAQFCPQGAHWLGGASAHFVHNLVHRDV